MKQFAQKLEQFLALGGLKKEIILLVVSGLALLMSILFPLPLPFDPAWVAIVLCGIPIILEAIIGLITAWDIKADVLVSLALVASLCIGEHFAAGEVAFIMQLGALLEDLTVSKARAGIEKLVHLTPRTARLVTQGGERVVPAQQVAVGDVLRVLPGESIPVDGVILEGQTSINQAVMTGESLPVDKTVGDEVSSGTVNQFGAFLMKATKVGEDSSIQRMIRLVQSADAGKAKIVRLADRWATWIVIIALSAALLTWIITGEIIRAVTVLVVFCPCALVLATPTAIMAAIGNVTRHGFLVREGDALERLAAAKVIAFDKTGTLTRGTPQVSAVVCTAPGLTREMVYAYAACAEQYSEHPLGKAVVRCYQQDASGPIPPAGQFQMIPGRGVRVLQDGMEILAGNPKMLAEHGVDLPGGASQRAGEFIAQGDTVIYIAAGGQLAGFLVLSDALRSDSSAMIERLSRTGVTPVLLTGDHVNAAQNIAAQLGIREAHAGCLPEDKLQWIDTYQRSNQPVCMIGDGINDAPALKKADVGIAMGSIGSDIAVDAADIVLVDDEVRELPHLLSLSRRMMVTIRWNMVFSMGLNFIAILLAMTGLLNPVIGALVHNAGSVLVILNSALLLKKKTK